ncbi:MAG: translocation/assembly module TamB domain-containing protein [Nitrospirae bacterium]|nr:translocation/assembly module TamB domain-containing protein [Nitrospirota bacterium]
MRTAFRVGLIGGLLLVIVAGVAYVTQRERVLTRFTRTLETTLAEQVGSPIEIGRLRLSLAPLALIAEHVTVRSPEATLSTPPLTVERITVRPSLISFLTETPVIRSLLIEHPRLTVTASPTGTSNLPSFGPAAPPPTTPHPPVLVGQIEIRNGDLAYRSPRGGITLSDAHILVVPNRQMTHFTVNLDAPRGAFEVGERTVALGTSRLRATAEAGRITLTSVSIEGPGLTGTAKGQIPLGERPGLDLSASASLDLAPLSAIFAPGTTVSGRVAVEGRITGSVSDPAIRGRINAHAVAYNGIPLGNLAATLALARGRLEGTDLVGEVLGGTLRGNASFDGLDSSSVWSVTLSTAHLRPTAFLRRLTPWATLLPPFETSGPLALRGRGWALRAVDGEGRLNLARHEAPAPSAPTAGSPTGPRVRALLALIASADAPWTLRNGALSIEGGAIASETGRLTLSGSLTPFGDVDLALALSDQDASAVAEALQVPFGVEGRAGFAGRLSGPLRDPLVEGRATIRNLALRGRRAGDLATSLRYADRTLSFRETDWRKDDARYDVSGTLGWTSHSSPEFDLTARLRKGRVGDILPIAFRPLPIEAVVDGTFTFRGSPADFQIAGDLDLADGSIYGQSFDQGRVGMTFDRRQVVFTHAVLSRGESEVRGHGSIMYHGGFDAQFDVPRLHLQTVDLFGLNSLPLSGTVSGTLTTRGTFDRPEMHAAVAILHLEGAGQVLGAGRVTLDVADRRVHLVAALDEQHARLESTLKWEPEFPLSAVLSVEDGSLVPLIRPWLPAALADMTAVVSGRVALDGPLLDPRQWRAESRLSRLSADVGEYVVENNGDLVLRLDQGRLTIDALRLRGTDTTLTVSGDVDLFREYHLLITGEADLRLTRLIVPTITSASGKTYLVLKISDRWDSPKIQGGVTVQDARLKSRALPQPITITSLGLFFNERQILLEALEGGFGRGRVSATGQILLEGFRPARFGYLIDLSEIQFPLTEQLTPTLSGQLVFQGTPESQSLRGELTVDRAIYDARTDIQDWVLDLRQRAEVQAATSEAPTLAHRLSLNIHFSGRNHIGVHNNLADIPLEVDLFLRGTADRPYLIGRVEAREGTITFRSNVFQVQSVTVDFIDPTRLRPVVDLRATTKVQSYNITLQLTGTVERFDLDLTSDPALSETDILALLTVGRTTEQVAQSPTGFGREEAASIALQTLLEEGVHRLPGASRLVDSFQIDPYYDETVKQTAPRLSVGKQLLENRLTVHYTTTLDSSGRQGVRVEYEIARNLFLIGEQDNRGFGGDVRYRFEFR